MGRLPLRGAMSSLEWLVVSLQLGVVVLLLGLPNLSVAVQYFSGQLPTERQTLALAGLCVWVAAVALAAVWVLAGVRRLRVRGRAMRHAGVLAVVLGLGVLSFGLVHHVAGSGYSQCCGSVATARQLVQVSEKGSTP
jgi:hypothetical protein